MNAVISTDRDYALHIRATWRIECLGDAFEEHFKAGRSGMNDHPQRLITAIAIRMPRSARKEGRAADGHFHPLPILPELHTTFENVKPLILTRVPVRGRTTTGRSHHLDHRERSSGLLATEQHGDLITECVENFALSGKGDRSGQ